MAVVYPTAVKNARLNAVTTASGKVLVKGSLAASETGADTFAATGTVGSAAITGTMAAQETGSDGFQGVGRVPSWAEQNARSYGKKRTQVAARGPTDAEIMRADVARLRQIEDEDELVLAVVMAATPILGVAAWQR